MKDTNQNGTQPKDTKQTDTLRKVKEAIGKQDIKIRDKLRTMTYLLQERFVKDLNAILKVRNNKVFVSQSVWGETGLLFCLSLCHQYNCEMLISNHSGGEYLTEVMFYNFRLDTQNAKLKEVV